MDRVRGADGRDLLLRVVAPGVVLWGLVVALGLAVTGPLAGPLNAEDQLNRGFLAARGTAWDLVTAFWSYLGSTEMIAAVALVVSVTVLWRTRDWRLAAVPVIAIVLELGVYLGATALIHRERPSVQRLETLLPMSSYPSGHVAASVSLYLSLIFLSSRLRSAAGRRVVIGICILVPVLVALGRFLRGMHHLSDILVGASIGVTCAVLAYGWYRHRSADTAPTEHTGDHITAHTDERPTEAPPERLAS